MARASFSKEQNRQKTTLHYYTPLSLSLLNNFDIGIELKEESSSLLWLINLSFTIFNKMGYLKNKYQMQIRLTKTNFILIHLKLNRKWVV